MRAPNQGHKVQVDFSGTWEGLSAEGYLALSTVPEMYQTSRDTRLVLLSAGTPVAIYVDDKIRRVL